MDHNYAFVT